MNTPVDFANLVLTLAWLAGPAGITAWMIYYSNLLRNLHEVDLQDPNLKLSPLGKRAAAWLQKRAPEVMQIIHGVGSFLLPGLAMIILEFVPPEWLVRAQPYYASLTMLFVAYLGSQVWYLWTKRSSGGPVIAQSILQTGPVTNSGPLDELKPGAGEPSFEDKVLDLRGTAGVTTTELREPQEFGERRPVGEPMGRVFSYESAHQREIRRNRNEALARNLARSTDWLGKKIA